MTTPAHRSPSESLLKAQPVIVHAVAAWIVGVLLFAAVHYHVVVPGLAPAVSAYLVPVVSALVGSAFTFSLWHFVAPAWKLAQAEAKLAGVTIPDFGPEPVSVPLKAGEGASAVLLPPALPVVDGVVSYPVNPDAPLFGGQVVGTRSDGTYDLSGTTALAVPVLPSPVDYVAQAAALTPATA